MRRRPSPPGHLSTALSKVLSRLLALRDSLQFRHGSLRRFDELLAKVGALVALPVKRFRSATTCWERELPIRCCDAFLTKAQVMETRRPQMMTAK